MKSWPVCFAVYRDVYCNVKKLSKTYQAFAQPSLLYINIGMNDATEEIWKTSLGLGYHELKISEKVFLFFQLKVMSWKRGDISH